jgi:hypothetical protein
MNIDQRIEALTQSVELLASLHADSEKRFQQIMTGSDDRSRRLEDNLTRLSQLTTDIAEGTARLLNAVQAHEERISDLEDNRPQQ